MIYMINISTSRQEKHLSIVPSNLHAHLHIETSKQITPVNSHIGYIVYF